MGTAHDHDGFVFGHSIIRFFRLKTDIVIFFQTAECTYNSLSS